MVTVWVCPQIAHVLTFVPGCSHGRKKEREIKLFLENHTRDHIFTVVADGEPGDVIPQILQEREVERVDENGNTVKFMERVEPLACDYRLPRREVKNTEVPRLVSAMIGCNYNELMDRQRQYKMKRLTAVAAAVVMLSLGFGGYLPV